MEDDFFNVLDAKRELRQGIVDCQKRGLVYSVKWLAEMCHDLANVDIDGKDEKDNFIAPKEYDIYFLAKSYFDCGMVSYHIYATYMAVEKRRLDSTTDQSNLNDSGHFKELGEILVTLRAEHSRNKLDGFGMYLYGVQQEGPV
ncbi:cell division cycle protein 23 homolog [Glossina fuscipes]|uniref:Cell division cycle protein 23 homolog n=1 Tax=Glossina fuscipes TaxID=7396 RepID=A0A9C5ZIP2_9MUSC|nr:cell division cycle protein 23 homolog [Glossina fuscipes]